VSSPPSVSIIIPVYNEEKNIGRCLTQVLRQDYPAEKLEVLIADGMSTDNTRAVIAEFDSGPIALRLLNNPGRGRAQGLNLAIRAARGELIARVDARSIIPPDYISSCVRALGRSGADNAGGVLQPLAETPTQEAIGIALATGFGVGNSQYRLGGKTGYAEHVYLGCFRREVFDKIGLFDETASIVSEDSDIDERIRAAGGKVYLDAQIVTKYYPRESFREFWKLYFRYGGARAGNLVKHRRLTSWRQAVAPAFVAMSVLLAVLSLLQPRFLTYLLAWLGTYFIADLTVSLWLAFGRRKPYLFWRLLVAFPCMHFAWALGFFKRLLTPQRPGTLWPN
jgi:succinoglycan biosynthesis protein ExoA